MKKKSEIPHATDNTLKNILNQKLNSMAKVYIQHKLPLLSFEHQIETSTNIAIHTIAI